MSVLSKERLTEKTKDCFGYRLKDGSDAEIGFFKDYDAFYSHMMVVKALGEYEDLEEQGLLLKLPFVDNDTEHRECVHTKATCHHKEYKCSECPLTELFCDEFYKAVERCYEEAYASGCLAGIELGKSEAEEKLRELNEESEE